MIKSLDRTNLRILAKEFERVMEKVAEEHGVSVRYKGGSYLDKAGTIRFEIGVKDESGKPATIATNALENLSPFIGVKAGDKFMFGNEVYEVTGYKPKNHKYPVIAKNWKGKSYKFPLSVTKNKV